MFRVTDRFFVAPALAAHGFAAKVRALRWLMAAWLVLALVGSAVAQVAVPADHGIGQGHNPRIRVAQTIWIDESRQLDFESVRTQDFKPFNPLERLTIGDKVVWLRLHMVQADGAAGPLLLQVLPPHLGAVALYSPAFQEPGVWRMQSLEPQALLDNIALGQAAQGDVFYLRISSLYNAALLAFVGERDDLYVHEKKLTVMMTFFTTVSLLTLLFKLWRAMRHFSWMLALICSLLVSSQMQFWMATGYLYTVLGFSLELGARLVTPVYLATIAVAGGIYILFATVLFPNQRWLRWVWGWSAFQISMFFYAFFEPSTASSLSMSVWRIGPLLLGVALTAAAIREPSSLRTLSSKVAFGLLLVTCSLSALVTLKSGGILGASSIELTTDLLINNILIRALQLLVIVVLAVWIFERIRTDQWRSLHGELQKSNQSLEIETKRLKRQRKFTAMLAHELKNPLAVSHMALSGIETRLGGNDPLLERAASIKQSLQDIDAIIERCSEIDGFEQGELPMSVSTFTLNHFMALVKEANANERIFMVMRGVQVEALLTSDIHYLKIIFSNLLTNALKYSPPDTLVELSVQSGTGEGGHKVMTFRISNEVGEAGTPAPSLAFERFYRAEAARNQSGAGLGLWLSQALAHALGSEVEMQHKGDTISFSLTLPYA